MSCADSISRRLGRYVAALGWPKVSEISGKAQKKKILLTKIKNVSTSTKSGIFKFCLTPYIEILKRGG
jgi:hypothetical protein